MVEPRGEAPRWSKRNVGAHTWTEQFIHVGMTDEVVGLIGHLPEGKGLLGALIHDPRPVRLRTLAEDLRSSGFPAEHPQMDSFLGVPIRVRDEVFGNLYLTNQKDGEFSADEAIAQAPAATAGIAIANARLFEDSRDRERWSTALAETNRHMLANEEESALQILIERMLELADADVACVVLAVPHRNQLVVDRAVGLGAEELEEMTFPLDGSIVEEVLAKGEARIVSSSDGYAPEQIGSIDDTIAQIRESIFALKTDARNPTGGLRSRLHEIIDRVADQLPSSPKARFLGRVVLMSDREITDDAAAVVTEALANILRHANCQNVTVTVTAEGGQLSIDVIDDGDGLGGRALHSGLANLLDRAEQRHGTFTIQDAKPRGSHLTWSVPV